MSTILFVHGTGVRADGFNHSFAAVQVQMARLNPKFEFRGCRWGEAHGADLHLKGVSIPDYEATRTEKENDPASEEEKRRTLWRLLFLDPLFEFRLMSERWKKNAAGGFGGPSLFEKRLQPPLNVGPRAEALRTLLQKTKLEATYAAAAEWLRQDPEFKKSVGDDGAPLLAARSLVARMAQLIGATSEESFSPLRTNPRLRDELVQAINMALTEQTYALLGDVFAAVFKPLAAGVCTFYARRHRGDVSDAASPGAGDILVYQARGIPIRNCIRKEIEKASAPVIIIAHSLGGVACVDLLVKGEMPESDDGKAPGKIEPGKVKLLITAGSQAPFFYEIGALQSLLMTDDSKNAAPDDRLPKHFPKWLNFYDPRDFLSYQGEAVFGKAKVTDKRVDNSLAFPDSHSGYWSNPEVWKTIGEHLP